MFEIINWAYYNGWIRLIRMVNVLIGPCYWGTLIMTIIFILISNRTL